MLNAFRHQRVLHLASVSTASSSLSRCSTPFGIKEFCTQSQSMVRVCNDPCSTPFGIKEFCTPASRARSGLSSAQRLSASKSSAPRAAKVTTAPLSAQRLSASKSSAQSSWPTSSPALLVLNAFRHQRVLHPRTHERAPFPFDVLNAFRHQRVLHLAAPGG